MAGHLGIDPRPLTLRQLLWMHQGATRSRWAHTSTLLALLANLHRDPQKHRAWRPEDFDPTTPRHTRRPASKQELAQLRMALEGRKGR